MAVSCGKTENLIQILSKSNSELTAAVRFLWAEIRSIKEKQREIEENSNMTVANVGNPFASNLEPEPPAPHLMSMPPLPLPLPQQMAQAAEALLPTPKLELLPPTGGGMMFPVPIPPPSLPPPSRPQPYVPAPVHPLKVHEDRDRPSLMVGRDGWALDPFDFSFPVKGGFTWEICPIPQQYLRNPPGWMGWPMVRLFSVEQGILMYKYLMAGMPDSAMIILNLR